MLPLPGQEHNNWDLCINTGIFSLPTHLISTKPPSHNWKCCFLPWGPTSACSNTRHGPALGCVWPQFPSPGWSQSLPEVMIPWRCLMPQAGAALNPFQMMNNTSHCAKMLLPYPDGHSNNGKGHRYSLLGVPAARSSFLEHWHLSLCPEPLPHAHSLSILSKLGGTLKPLWACNEQSQPERTLGVTMAGMGSTSPAPDFYFQSFCCFPFNKMFRRK